MWRSLFLFTFLVAIASLVASDDSCQDKSGLTFCRNNCDSVRTCKEDERCARRCKSSCNLCQYFVAVDGSDSWDGSSESRVGETDTGPWQSLDHALTELRKIRPNPPTADSHVTIYLLPGTHYLSSTINMNRRDSFITIKALGEDDEVIISGGLVLDGEWTEEEGGIKTMTFQGSCGEAFVGQQRLVSARSPNLVDFSPNMNTALPPYNIMKDLLLETETCIRETDVGSQECPDEDRMGFVFEDEFSSDWTFLDQTRVLIFHSGIAEYAIVKNVTEDNGSSRVFFEDPLSRDPIGNKPASSGWRYLIFNNKALLDAPSECVCNEVDENIAKFSYIQPDDPQLQNMPVVISQLTLLLNLNRVSDVHIEGIIFKHSSSGGVINSDFGTAAVRITHSENIVVTDCKFTQTGMTGLYGTDSRNVQVTKSIFTDMGFHGIQFHYKNDGDELEGQMDITIDNNMFDGCGMNNFWQPACVKVGGYYNIAVRNNEITNVPYNAVRVAGLMPHGADYWEDINVNHPRREDYVFHVEFNYIHDYGLGMLNDMGAIYLSKYLKRLVSSQQERRITCTYILHPI